MTWTLKLVHELVGAAVSVCRDVTSPMCVCVRVWRDTHGSELPASTGPDRTGPDRTGYRTGTRDQILSTFGRHSRLGHCCLPRRTTGNRCAFPISYIWTGPPWARTGVVVVVLQSTRAPSAALLPRCPRPHTHTLSLSSLVGHPHVFQTVFMTTFFC